MHVAAIHIYPVKGCHRLDRDEAGIEPWGLAGDRRWLVVEAETGRMMTQREDAGLTRIHPMNRDAGLQLRTPGLADLEIPEPAGGERVEVKLWRSDVKLVRAGGTADAWLSEALGRKVWLTWLDDPTQRPVDPDYAQPGDRVNLADSHPLLVANVASLAALNATLDEPVPMTRFRPNIEVVGATGWAEDGWIGRRMRVGPVEVRVTKACGRCVVTTIDQESGEKGREPLRMLGQIRRFPSGLLFGVYLIPDGVGRVAIGDEVTLLD